MTTTVLVLNASYEPVSRTRLSRAMVLVQRGIAVIEEAVPDRFIRSSLGVVPVPRVLRLLRYVKVNALYGPASWSKRGVLVRDAHTCAYCGAGQARTVDHVLPVSRGGASSWVNTVAACTRCNGKKADRTPAEAMLRLRVTPYTPTRAQLALAELRRQRTH
jgi:hypothetical protein